MKRKILIEHLVNELNLSSYHISIYINYYTTKKVEAEGANIRIEQKLQLYDFFCQLHLILSQSLSNLVFLRVKGVTLFVGSSNEMVSLTPGLSTMRFRELRILCLLGRVFGNQRFLSEWLSFCGQLLMVGFLLWIISYLGVALRQIGVVCVVVMGSRWTTFFFIVMLHIPYGLLCFRLLVFIGLCQDRWQDFYFFGINGLGIILRIFEI